MKRNHNHIEFYNDIKKQKFNVDMDNLEFEFNNVNLDSSEQTLNNLNHNHIEFYNDIKKQKFNVDMNNLEFELNNVNLDSSEQTLNNPNDTEYLSLINEHKNFDNINLININYINEIKNSIEFIHKNTSESKLTFDLIIIMSNDIIENIGKDKYIHGTIKDDYLQDKLFSQYISSMLYPNYLIQPYFFDDDFKTNCVDVRDINLSNICTNTKCLFPTWKKTYNYNTDYNYSNLNNINQKICKNFIKKIFDFYEKVYFDYYNIMVGNILSFIFSNYEINLNPYDNKFNKVLCLEWIEAFNQVLINCKKFIKNYAILIELEKIDELDKIALIKKFTQLNNLYLNILSKKNNDVHVLFTPLEKFQIKKLNDKKKIIFIETNCLNKINNEIEYIFKLKSYINIVSKNNWITQFRF
jgi:hypothetical protein